MTKFIEFKTKTSGVFREEERISDRDIYDFVAWASDIDSEDGPSRPISSVTIKKYLDGIRAWHIFRHMSRPTADSEVVKTLIREGFTIRPISRNRGISSLLGDG